MLTGTRLMKMGSWPLFGSAAKVSRLGINPALGDPTQKWGVGVRWGWRHRKLHATGACGAGECDPLWLFRPPAELVSDGCDPLWLFRPPAELVSDGCGNFGLLHVVDLTDEFGWRHVPESTVRPTLVVVDPPSLEDRLSLAH